MKIITGGQSGGDLSGNYFALKNNIPTEINAFKDFKPINDSIPINIKINYVCDKKTYSDNLKCRTLYNINNSDLTIILLKENILNTSGSLFTFYNCTKLNKNVITTDIYTKKFDYTLFGIQYFTYRNKPTSLKEMITKLKPNILNIAGQRDLNKTHAIKYLETILL